MSEEAGTSPRRGRRLLVFGLIAALVLAAIAALAYVSNIPQQRGLIAALESALGVEVTVSKIQLVPDVQVARLAVYDGPSEVDAEQPALVVEGLHLGYDWRELNNPSARPLNTLRVDAVYLTLDGTNPEDTNYDFVQRLLERPSDPEAAPNLRFVPRKYAVGSVEASLAVPSMAVSIAGLSVDAQVGGTNDIAVSVVGDDLRGAYQSRMLPLQDDFDDGAVDVKVAIDEEGISANPLRVQLPGLASINARFLMDNDSGAFALDMDSATINTLDLSDTPQRLIPIAIRFDQLDLSGTHLRANRAANWIEFEESELNATADDLTLGPADAPYYSGDLSAQGTASQDTAELTLTLNEGQTAVVSAEGNLDRATATLSLDNWSRKQIEGALPQFLHAHLHNVPNLASLTGGVEARWARPTLELVMDTAATMSGPDASGTLRVDGTVVTDTGTKITHANLKGGIAGGTYTAQGAYDGDGAYNGSMTLAAVPFGETAKILGLPETLQDFETTVTGEADIEGNSEEVNAAVEIMARPVPFVAYPLPEGEGLGLSGKLQYAFDAESLHGSNTTLRLGTDGQVRAAKWQAGFDPFNWSGPFEGEADVGAMAARFEWGPLSGEAAFQGEAALRGDDLDVSPTVTIDGLAYGGWGLSYGTPAVFSGDAALNLDSSAGVISDFAAKIGDGTVVDFSDTNVRWDPLGIEAAFTATTDLYPLVDLGLLASADGSGQAVGHMQFDESGFSARFDDSKVEAFTLELPDGAARLSGITAEGAGGYGAAGFTGAWRVGAARAEAAGVVVTDVFGNAQLNGKTATIAIDQGSLYEGRVLLSEIDADFSGDELVLSGTVQIRDVELAVFTEEFKPPGTRLTGTVMGVLEFTLEGSTITAADVKLRAPNGFSINKDLIREQLLRQTVSDATYGLIFREDDDDPEGQRHFDSAVLELTYVPADGELQGEAKMLSEELRLTMPMTIDIRVITEALTRRQLQMLQGMEDIQLAPVELVE